MIKVFDNGVPLAAIVSVKIDEAKIVRIAAYDRARKKILAFGSERYWVDQVRHMVISNRPKLALSEADLRVLRAHFLAEWPEVAAFFAKK